MIDSDGGIRSGDARKEGHNANIRRTTTASCTDRGHIDLDDSTIIELYRCALSYRDGNPRARARVAARAPVKGC
jgi:hypothetical protein